MRFAVGLLAFIAIAAHGATAEQAADAGNPWSAVGTPTRGKAEAIGSPNHGCLAGGVRLPPEGPGFQVSRPERRRNFAHPDTIDFIEALARRAQAAGLPLLYVGDMSQPRGGPMPASSHHSHETGLDVDLWFTFGPKYTPGAPRRAARDPRSMLQADGGHIDPVLFGANQMTLLRFALADPRVDRILVNPAIKVALCRGAAGANYFGTDWLHRLQPWPGHDDHFHVRLRCPETSPACVGKTSDPDSDSCGAVLTKWLVHPPPPPEAPPPAPYPTACQHVLNASPRSASTGTSVPEARTSAAWRRGRTSATPP